MIGEGAPGIDALFGKCSLEHQRVYSVLTVGAGRIFSTTVTAVEFGLVNLMVKVQLCS